jgi:hypothetical protein
MLSKSRVKHNAEMEEFKNSLSHKQAKMEFQNESLISRTSFSKKKVCQENVSVHAAAFNQNTRAHGYSIKN